MASLLCPLKFGFFGLPENPTLGVDQTHKLAAYCVTAENGNKAMVSLFFWFHYGGRSEFELTLVPLSTGHPP